MSFLDRVKRDMNDPRKNRPMGRGSDCLVDYRALTELIDNFERLESQLRINNDHHEQPVTRLHNAIVAAYHDQGKSNEMMMLDVVTTLQQLMNDNYELNVRRQRVGRG